MRSFGLWKVVLTFLLAVGMLGLLASTATAQCYNSGYSYPSYYNGGYYRSSYYQTPSYQYPTYNYYYNQVQPVGTLATPFVAAAQPGYFGGTVLTQPNLINPQALGQQQTSAAPQSSLSQLREFLELMKLMQALQQPQQMIAVPQDYPQQQPLPAPQRPASGRAPAIPQADTNQSSLAMDGKEEIESADDNVEADTYRVNGGHAAGFVRAPRLAASRVNINIRQRNVVRPAGLGFVPRRTFAFVPAATYFRPRPVVNVGFGNSFAAYSYAPRVAFVPRSVALPTAPCPQQEVVEEQEEIDEPTAGYQYQSQPTVSLPRRVVTVPRAVTYSVAPRVALPTASLSYGVNVGAGSCGGTSVGVGGGSCGNSVAFVRPRVLPRLARPIY